MLTLTQLLLLFFRASSSRSCSSFLSSVQGCDDADDVDDGNAATFDDDDAGAAATTSMAVLTFALAFKESKWRHVKGKGEGCLSKFYYTPPSPKQKQKMKIKKDNISFKSIQFCHLGFFFHRSLKTLNNIKVGKRKYIFLRI